MAEVIAKAIADSPDAMLSLATIPADVRSDADAIMLWNGAWTDDRNSVSAFPFGLFQNDPLQALKATVIDALAAAPPNCLAISVQGPRLIPIQEPGRTTMLVIGSGDWKWSDLLDPATLPISPSSAAARSADQTLPVRPTGN